MRDYCCSVSVHAEKRFIASSSVHGETREQTHARVRPESADSHVLSGPALRLAISFLGRKESNFGIRHSLRNISKRKNKRGGALAIDLRRSEIV